MEDLQHKIFSALEQNDLYHANNYMSLLCNMLNESNSQSKDAYINLFFAEGVSVITYINKILKLDTVTKVLPSTSRCVQVIYTLLNNFPCEMADHIISIINLCNAVLFDSKFAQLKPKCAEIFLLLVVTEEIVLSEEVILHIYSRVKEWLNSDKNTTSLTIFVQILGALSGRASMTEKLSEIAEILICFLRKSVCHAHGSQNLFQGGYKATYEFMKHSAFSSEQQLLLYKYMKRDVQYNSDLYKKQGSRTVVQFVAQSADVFADRLADDVTEWSTSLQEWLHSPSRDDSRAGYDALIAVYKSVGGAWARSETLPEHFHALLAKSKAILEETTSNSAESKIAICTLGYLAPTAAKHLSRKDFRDLFLFLLQRIEYVVFVKFNANANVVTAASCDYVEAISPFLATLTKDIELHINQFKRVTIILVKMFPGILASKHQIVVGTLLSMFDSIARCSYAVFRDFIDDVVKQGVIWTCSHSLAQEIEIYDLDEVSYKRYLPLWHGLLDDKETHELNEIQKALWDPLIRNYFYMSDKLNLRVTIKDLQTPEGMRDELQAEKRHDFVIFANLTDFYCDLLAGANAMCLKPWLDTFCDHIIRKSTQLPLVSGFYKLLATVMKLFESIDYFHVARIERKENVRITFENVRNHAKHALKQVHRFKNELQLSCMLLILQMPMAVVRSMRYYDFSDTFVTAFKLGQHNTALGTLVLDTLSRWYEELADDVIHPLLRKTVPCLDAYLRNQFVVGDNYHVEARKLKKYGQRKLEVEVEPELVQLQHKALRFLAMLPNEICLELSARSADLTLAKREANLLRVDLSFGEGALPLWLDPFVERVLALSVEGADRKVRITACELLHSIVAVFLGMSVQISPSTALDPHLKKLVAALLRLASDQDATVVALFKPLLLQMAHWYSQRKHVGSEHAHIFLALLLRGACDERDGAVRDSAGEVLREFVAWTRKQTTKAALKDHLHNIGLIVEHIKQCSLHPDEAKRYGATVIFNNIYKELREEDAIVDAFWLEILYACVMNLSLVAPAASDDDDLLHEINLCLDRVARCLLEKRALFQRGNARSTPPTFSGNTFEDAALFLLQFTCHINSHCRATCMEIFRKVPRPLVDTVAERFNLHVPDPYLHDLAASANFDDVQSIEEVLRYFASLTCFIDGRLFIAQMNYDGERWDALLWPLLDRLVDAQFKTKTLPKLQERFGTESGALVRRIKDEFVFYRAKLVEKVLELYSNAGLARVNASSWAFVADYLFDYRSLGLVNLTHKRWTETATNLIGVFISAVPAHAPYVNEVRIACRCKLEALEEMEAGWGPESDVSWSRRQLMKGLLLLQRVDPCDTLNLALRLSTSPLATLYAILGLDGVDGPEGTCAIATLKDTQREYFALRVQIMLDGERNPRYEQDLSDLLRCLCSERLLYSTELRSTVPQGVFVFLLFRKPILEHCVTKRHLHPSLQTIAASASPDVWSKYFKEFLKHAHSTPKLKEDRQLLAAFVKSAESLWAYVGSAGVHETQEDGERRCLDLIYDLRLIVDELSCAVMCDSVAAVLRRERASDVQQMHHLRRVVRAFGMVSPRGFSPMVAERLEELRAKSMRYFGGAARRVATTLFIKALFDATSYSFACDFFVSALDFYVVLENDFEADAAFCREFIAKMPRDLQLPLLNRVHSMGKHYNHQQKIVLALCLCNLIANCEYEVFEAFYVQHTAAILQAFSSDCVADKTLACIMLNRLFGNINAERFAAKTCRITQAVCARVVTGKELVARVAQLLLDVCKAAPTDGGEDALERFRLYQCYAYNALTTLVCNALKGKADFYRKLFARSDANGDDILWCKLVPLHKRFNLEVMSEDIPKKRRILSDIRTERPVDVDIEPQQYLASQNLFLSTLAEDITNYDFTNVCVRVDDGRSAAPQPAAMCVEMYDEDINKHECMLPVCGVIKHMHEAGLLAEDAPPPWVHDVAGMLLKPTAPPNVRQFLCKVVENSQAYLKPYAPLLTAGVVRAVCETCDGLNGLAVDCAVMLLTQWSSAGHRVAHVDATLLIEFLMKHLWSERTDVFKYNVDLLRTAVETYGEYQPVDGFMLTLFPPTATCKSNLALVHIVNALLANNISPFPGTLKTFMTKLCGIMTGNADRSIYTATAETLGLALKFFEEVQHPSRSNFAKKLTEVVEKLYKEDEVRFVPILEAITKNYPAFGVSFLRPIYRWIESSSTSEGSRLNYLQIFLKCIHNVCELELIHKLSLDQWLASTSLDIVVVAMEIVLKAVDLFDADKAMLIAETALDLPTGNAVCRTIRIDVLIAFARRFASMKSVDSARWSAIVKRLKRSLIDAFADPEPEIRSKVHAFWTAQDFMSAGMEQKLLHLLEELYDDASEELYLTFSSVLLLHGLVGGDEPLFKAPLHSCSFQPYEVSAYWRAQNASMMPMFTSSLSTSRAAMLRATQSYEFEQTQSQHRLTAQRRSYAQSASALTFAAHTPPSKGSVFKQPNDYDGEPAYKVKKWRFFKNKADVSKAHAIREIRKGEQIVKQRHDAEKKREQQTKIYRRYRAGDFPDIQINVGAVVELLGELSRLDGGVAKLLYKSLFDAVAAASASDAFLARCNRAIQRVFAETSTYDPACIGALLHIGLEHKCSLRFPADTVKAVATKSGNLAVGCLLLEEYLTASASDETPAKRGVAAAASEATAHWMRLAELCRTMEEWDVVHGVFANCTACPRELPLAIKAESENCWGEARNYYLRLIQDDYDAHRRDFYYEAFFKCSEELSDWREIEQRCVETAGSSREEIFAALWSSEWNVATLLPYYVKSQVRAGDADHAQGKQAFEASLKQAMADGGRKEHLRNEFADELSLFYLDVLKVKLAASHSEHHAKKFLRTWAFTHPLYASVQNKALLAMKNCAEISVLLRLYDRIAYATYDEVIATIANLWAKSNAKNASIPTAHLATRMTLRESFVNLTRLKLMDLGVMESEKIRMMGKLTEFSLGAEVDLAEKALSERNLQLAKVYVQRSFTRTDATGAQHPVAFLLFSKCALLKAQYAPADREQYFFEAFKAHQVCTSRQNFDASSRLAIDAALHLTALCNAFVAIAKNEEEQAQAMLVKYSAFVPAGALRRVEDLRDHGLENLRDTLHRLDQAYQRRKQHDGGDQQPVGLADAFLSLANEYAARGGGYEHEFIECSLKSMQYGSEKARLVFPKLLDVDNLLTMHRAQFIQQTSNIPTYMFIAWIPQLLAYCDTEKVSVIQHIVIKLAREYPNSIIYAYKLSREKFTFTHEATRDVTNILDELLRNDLVEKMLSALKYVAVSSTIIKTAVMKLSRACKDSQKAWIRVGAQVSKLFEPEADSTLRGDHYNSVLKYKDMIMPIISYTPFNKEVIEEKLRDVKIDKVRNAIDLSRYSPWLNDFHASNYDVELEVPGCYAGLGRPLPRYHPKIAKFSPDVTVLHSIQCPIRITIYANDVKEYRFLVKYGEDLRMDQRIQQLFKQMNVALSGDVKCRERKLQVSTYEVIPLTGDLGFIQWVDETETLWSFLRSRRGSGSIQLQMDRAREMHEEWVRKAGRGQDTYAQASVRYTEEETTAHYQMLVNMLPWDALRKSLWSISPDPETFFALRMTFIRSYAVMCVANWLLGIGDRHLENILLDVDTGRVVGIDFGHAFGAATQEQSVPELVPFRLTPQIVNVMQPLKESGLLHQTMTHALRVLRENGGGLLSMMNIFVVEPTLEWSAYNGEAWNPAIIMQLARAKVEGASSVSVMIAEINARRRDAEHVKRAYVQCLEALARGMELEETGESLSVHEQIDCLIAHATAPTCLGRMYSGWAPWM